VKFGIFWFRKTPENVNGTIRELSSDKDLFLKEVAEMNSPFENGDLRGFGFFSFENDLPFPF
jgi:hypothetical protein